MSTVTVAAVEAPDRPVSPTRSLARAVLRPHQSALWFWGLLVFLIAAVQLWAAGPGVDSAWMEYVSGGCATSDFCGTGAAYSLYSAAVDLGSLVLTIAPALVGAWAGGSLIGRELESGTTRLLWTQSVAPTRWLAAKVAVSAVLIGSGTVLLTLLHRLVWAQEEPLRHGMGSRDWFSTTTYMANGTLATAYALLGLAVGVFAGMLVRRSLPALAIGFVGVAALMATFQTNRHHLWPVEEVGSASMRPRWSGMLVDQGIITASGDRISTTRCLEPDCGRSDVVGRWTEAHPSSHFWPLQLVETGLVLTLAALLVLAAFHLLRRRTGGTP